MFNSMVFSGADWVIVGMIAGAVLMYGLLVALRLIRNSDELFHQWFEK